jgi:antitoxin PrlF
MAAATVTSKGQTTIPKKIREHLHLHPGDQIEYIIGENGSVTIFAKTLDAMDLKGLLKTKVKKSVSLEEMDEAIKKGAARESR